MSTTITQLASRYWRVVVVVFWPSSVLTSHGCMHFANSYVCHSIHISLARLREPDSPSSPIRVRGRPVTSPAQQLYRGIQRNQQCSSVWHIMCISIAHTLKALYGGAAHLTRKRQQLGEKRKSRIVPTQDLVVWVLCYCLQSPRTGITHICICTRIMKDLLCVSSIYTIILWLGDSFGGM